MDRGCRASQDLAGPVEATPFGETLCRMPGLGDDDHATGRAARRRVPYVETEPIDREGSRSTMTNPYSDGSNWRDRRGERIAQARRFAGQARQNRTTAWYVPFAITLIAAGASFDAFGRAIGFLYALGVTLAFVAQSWRTMRLVPSMVVDLNIERASGPRKIRTLAGVPVTMHGIFVVAAVVPIFIALVKTVGFFVLGGLLIVTVVTGAALAAAWTLDRRG